MKLTDGIGRTFTVQRLAPGLYLDTDGAAHMVASEMLAAMEWPDTRENRQACFEALRDLAREMGSDIAVDWIDPNGRHGT